MENREYGGKRGRKGKGYSKKTIKGKTYIYVWGSYNKEETDKVRKKTENGKFSHSGHTIVNGWFCLGREDRQETWEELHSFLNAKQRNDEAEATAIIERIRRDKLTKKESKGE